MKIDAGILHSCSIFVVKTMRKWKFIKHYLESFT